MSAAEIARLANIALADIGLPPNVTPDGTWTGNLDDHPMAYRACALAMWKLEGADADIECEHHCRRREAPLCSGVIVADALRGRLCLYAGVS